MNHETIIQTLHSRVPNLLAIYAFGSQVQGTAGPDSDLDLAMLVAGYAEPLTLWELAGDLADTAGCAVDLVDLRAASTVMQYRIITTGQRWWARDVQAALYEAATIERCVARARRNTPAIPPVLPLISPGRTPPSSTFSAPAKQRWTWVNT